MASRRLKMTPLAASPTARVPIMRRLTPGFFAIERSANRTSRTSWDIEGPPSGWTRWWNGRRGAGVPKVRRLMCRYAHWHPRFRVDGRQARHDPRARRTRSRVQLLAQPAEAETPRARGRRTRAGGHTARGRLECGRGGAGRPLDARRRRVEAGGRSLRQGDRELLPP